MVKIPFEMELPSKKGIPPPAQETYREPPPPYRNDGVSQTREVGQATQLHQDKLASARTRSQSVSSSSSSSSVSTLSSFNDEAIDTPRRSSATPSIDSSTNRLLKPIAIPATSKKLGSPFLRAYPPVLNSPAYGLSAESFLSFLDDLNRIAVASPPFRVLGLVGAVVSFVPVTEAQIVGNAVNAAAQLGTYAISKGRTEMFLRKANKEIFGPRGLKVEIAKIRALAKVASMPILNADGKIDKGKPLLAPLEDLVTTRKMSGQQRRLRALESYIASLEVQADALPKINKPSNPLSKMNVNASEKQRAKEEKKMLKGRRKAYKHQGYENSEKAQEALDNQMARLDMRAEKKKQRAEEKGKSDYKIQKKLEKVEKRREKAIRKHEKEVGKSDGERLKKRISNDEEEKSMRKILWLIIRNIDDDSGDGPDPYTDGDVEDIAGRSNVNEPAQGGRSELE